MGGFFRQSRGSILVMSLVLFTILLIIALTFVGQEIISKEAAARSRMAGAQDSSINVTLQRFADNFSKKPSGSIKLDFPSDEKSPTKPRYNLGFKSSSKREGNFSIRGTWKDGESIYYPPREFPGKDFTDITQGGYYKDVAAQGSDQTPVPPWHNFMALNSSMDAKFFTVFAYHFPYGAFAPSGKIKLRDAYGCSNDIDDKDVNGDYFSSVPVDIYSRDDLEIDEYVNGKAFSATGNIAINSKKGAVARTGISKRRQKEFTAYTDILQKQVNNAFDSIKKSAFDRDKIILGRPATNISTFINNYPEVITLEQGASFPFACMMSFEENPEEKVMGCYYPFRIHCPFPPDKKSNIGADSKTAWKWTKQMYQNCDKAQAAFEHFEVDWRRISTEDAISNAFDAASEELKTESTSLAAELASAAWEITASVAAEGDPEVSAITMAEIILDAIGDIEAIVAVANISKYSQAYFSLDHYEYLLKMDYYLDNVKKEPLTRIQDAGFNNTGFQIISAFYEFNDRIRNEITGTLEKDSETKYQAIGGYLKDNCVVNCRLVHFGWGDFVSNFRKINTDGFTFEGTIIIPRGRTLKFGRDLTILGDLWIQDGASLYVGGSLTMAAPPAKDFPDLHEMVRPSGRLFLGNGSTLLVENDFQCQGSQAYGSVMVTSPADKVYTISSGIISNKGNITIPYGIMPGISIDRLAEAGDLLTEDEISNLKTYIQISPNVARLSGPFFGRKDYFASNAACFIAERLKDLDNKTENIEKIMLVPVNLTYPNVLSSVFQGLTGIFTLNLNAYLGQYFLAHSEWWIFGEGAVPIIPKMDLDKTGAQLGILRKNLVSTAQSVVACNEQVNSTLKQVPGILEATKDALIACVNVYQSYDNYKFMEKSDSTALSFGKSCVEQVKQAGTPVASIVGRINLFDTQVKNSVTDFHSFCKESFSVMGNHLPGGSYPQSFRGVPGILVYAGKKLTLGVEDEKVKNITFPASGLFIAGQDLQINGSFRVVGCLVSLQGDIYAEGTRLRFYPYFTKASLYLPKDFKGDGSAELTAIDDNSLKSGANSLNIGITMPRFQAGGWEYYTEDYYGKD